MKKWRIVFNWWVHSQFHPSSKCWDARYEGVQSSGPCASALCWASSKSKIQTWTDTQGRSSRYFSVFLAHTALQTPVLPICEELSTSSSVECLIKGWLRANWKDHAFGYIVFSLGFEIDEKKKNKNCKISETVRSFKVLRSDIYLIVLDT